MRNSDRFLNIYNQLDDYMRHLLDQDSKVSHIFLIDTLAKKSNLFRHYRNDLKEFAELRNAIVHNTHFCDNRYGEIIAEPHDVVVDLYEELLEKIMKPIVAKDIYRKITDKMVLTANLDDKIIDIIKKMYNKSFTCVPILQNYKLIGVFSENVLLSLIAQKDVCDFNRLKIKDILKLIDIRSHHGEYFAFCKVKDNIFDVKSLFQNNKNKKRLEMVFVTGNGKENEDILGVISAWDLV